MSAPTPMTPGEIARLQAELAHLKTTGRRRAREELVRARAYGDFRENAEFEEAKRAQAILEGRIVELQGILGRARAVESTADVGITVGATVVLRDLTTPREIHLTVGAAGHTSDGTVVVTPDSPMGRALIGKRPPDEVEVETPSGTHRYAIVSVSFPDAE